MFTLPMNDVLLMSDILRSQRAHGNSLIGLASDSSVSHVWAPGRVVNMSSFFSQVPEMKREVITDGLDNIRTLTDLTVLAVQGTTGY